MYIPPLILALLILPLSSTAHQAKEPYRATVHIANRVVNRVNPLIFGDNIEWVNNGMGVWNPSSHTLDAQIVKLIKEVGVTQLRYPGGTLSDYFDWSKAIGPSREAQPNPFNNGTTQMPVFGPDEFAQLCASLKIQGMITLNAGSSSPENGAAWVEYYKRKGVKITAYEFGNEVYMSDPNKESIASMPTAMAPDKYVDRLLRCRAEIDNKVHGTHFGAVGLLDTGTISLNKQRDWVKTVLSKAGNKIDFLAIHNGYAPVLRSSGFGPSAKRYSDQEFALCFLAAPNYIRDNIHATLSAIAQFAPQTGKHIDIHITEYGPLVYPVDQTHVAEDAIWNRTLTAALYQACFYNMLLREPRVTSANHLPLCQDVYGALIGIHFENGKRSLWRNIVYYVFQLYARQAGRDVLDTKVESPLYSSHSFGIVPELMGVTYLDAGCYRSKDGKRLALFLVNRNLRRSAKVKVEFGLNGYKVYSTTSIAATDIKAVNSPDKPNAVVPVKRRGKGGLVNQEFTVPPHSLIVVDCSK